MHLKAESARLAAGVGGGARSLAFSQGEQRGGAFCALSACSVIAAKYESGLQGHCEKFLDHNRIEQDALRKLEKQELPFAKVSRGFVQ